MNINICKRKQKHDFNNTLNNNIYYNNFNPSGKIMEKLIIMNNENTLKKEKKIKEFEISIKKTNLNGTYLRRQKSNNIFKLNLIPNLKKPPNNEPYLKPKFQIKNKNSFSIKNKNKNTNTNNININNNCNSNSNNNTNINNDEIKNIYLNFFKVYYDENGKKVKIIKNKSNYKENKSKEIILTQKNNMDINNDWIRDRNNNLRKNYKTDTFDTKNNNDKNLVEMKCISPETPSQSTTTDNKSNAKSGKNIRKEEINNINKTIEMLNKQENDLNINEKNNVIKNNIYYDNLPLFLKKRKNLKKNEKKYKKKNIDIKYNLNNTEKLEKLSFLGQSFNKFKKFKNELDQDFLIEKLNNKNSFNSKNNNDTKISLNNIRKNKSKIDITKDKKINYFHNDISNLTLNMTFEQKNITNSINNDNPKIKNIYISSFKKKKNIKKEIPKINPICLNNNFDNISLANKTIDSRHSLGNCVLFNFFGENDNNKELNRNKSYGYQNISNYKLNTRYDIHRSCHHNHSNSSINSNYIKKYNYSNAYNENENEISILNKTKEILKMREDDLIKNNNQINRKTVLNNSRSYIDFIPQSLIKIKKNKSTEKLNHKIHEKIINIPHNDYYKNSKVINEDNQQNLKASINSNLFNKNRRPCSLYINKKVSGKKNSINDNNCFLNKYCNNAINKNTHLNNNINNIYINTKYLEQKSNSQYNTLYKREDNEKQTIKTHNNINFNIKTHINNQKFLNINQNGSTQQLINKRIKINNNTFKFHRNRCCIGHYSTSNNSLKLVHSCIKINKNL